MFVQLLTQAYAKTPVGHASWVMPYGNCRLEDFQLVVAAAEAWEHLRHIRILEIREDKSTGRRLIEALRFCRLK